MPKRLPQVGSHSDREAQTLKVAGTQHFDGLEDALDGVARRIQHGVRDGENLAGKGGIGGDQLAQPAELHVFIRRQLQHLERNLRKRRHSEVGPGHGNRPLCNRSVCHFFPPCVNVTRVTSRSSALHSLFRLEGRMPLIDHSRRCADVVAAWLRSRPLRAPPYCLRQTFPSALTQV